MKKRLLDQPNTRATRRSQKKRPRMQLHGRSLKFSHSHAGKKLSLR